MYVSTNLTAVTPCDFRFPVPEESPLGKRALRTFFIEETDDAKRQKTELSRFIFKDTSGFGNLMQTLPDPESMIQHRGDPSSSSMKDMKKTQNSKYPILNGRPNHGLPIGLYHPVFDDFRFDLKHSGDWVPTAEDYIRATEVFRVSSALYNDERERTDALKRPLSELLGETLIVFESGRNDGIMLAVCGTADAITSVLKVKNEIGEGGSDPSFQGCLSYRMYWAAAKVSPCDLFEFYPDGG